MMPRIPTDLNHNVVTRISPGQMRFLALRDAVRLAIECGENDPDVVVQTAEKFYAFLTPETDKEIDG